MTDDSRLLEQADTFWNFLGCLKSYLVVIESLETQTLDDDPKRTTILSQLASKMRRIFRAQVSFVGFFDTNNNSNISAINIVNDSIDIEHGEHWNSDLVNRLQAANYRLLQNELVIVENRVRLFFDTTCQELPTAFKDVVSSLAVGKVLLGQREYYLFFCDVVDTSANSPRYNSFDRTMLEVVTGILQTGFSSGLRQGTSIERERHDIETRRYIVFTMGTIAVLVVIFSLLIWLMHQGIAELSIISIGGIAIILFIASLTAILAYTGKLSEPATRVFESITSHWRPS